MKNTLILSAFAAVLLFSSYAFALDLNRARAQGLVGEKLDGYVGVVTSSSDATAVANDVNTRRRAEYDKISKANGQPVSVVAKVASESIINGLPSGSFYQGADGSWKKK